MSPTSTRPTSTRLPAGTRSEAARPTDTRPADAPSAGARATAPGNTAARPGGVRRHTAVLALITTAALALTACGTGDPATTPAGAAGAKKGAVPTADVVSAVTKDEAAAALLPADVRQRGTVSVASSTGSLPGAAYLPDGRTLVGGDVDLTDAVAKVLGLRLTREVVSWEAILPALGSGKYDFGTGNFGVTEERRRTIDFVTYINDGQGFAARADSPLKKVTDLTQLCGLNVATGGGTTFEATLERNKARCSAAGRKPYTIQSFSDQGAQWMSLQQGRSDVLMSTVNGLRYAVTQQENVRFLNEYRRLDVGFAFKKGTPLAPAFQAAVNRLKKDGTYDRILRKWGLTDSAIAESRISPPEIPAPTK
ncbi:ABC transporter substrate-binding protein [Streptomyces sp. NPDC048338]|uniref:ABC transporter substrate-binding protein n=1 Tax=Streptomyces sp. NPDC048338 TaxID=3365536 RepID=UPI003715939F